ncbi:succinyl-CoA--3-ketoacid-CoA transferase [Neobacillus piezotolerans]|uniref:Succinyl-CoA--3-ketoacid-CoA transferase n=1 Tax=Neobacillus piezotolerans TaxID=2259171 RepID=A0A3D8GQF3_9BACI|nr:3-oxoacid CoA-transferase subunit B [Neobacillus piezotolerans]RDU36557.1 succinyl-CoA--3-ketoacid-CoA transferase [Neobacillus piezotolerans]
MSKTLDPKKRIASRIAEELKPGMVVNLGVGIPTLIPEFLQQGNGVFLHSENGMLGMGPPPPPEELDMDCISASKHPVTLEPGAAIFSSSDSFGMIRGGHIDVVVLGALQISEKGEIANWAVPGTDILGVGGAMDLVPGAKKIIAAMTHTAKDGSPKLVRELAYPTTGIQCAKLVVTELAVFSINGESMLLEELAEGTTIDELRAVTDARFHVSTALKTWHDGN